MYPPRDDLAAAPAAADVDLLSSKLAAAQVSGGRFCGVILLVISLKYHLLCIELPSTPASNRFGGGQSAPAPSATAAAPAIAPTTAGGTSFLFLFVFFLLL